MVARTHGVLRTVTLERRAAILQALDAGAVVDKQGAAAITGLRPEAAAQLLGELCDEGCLRRTAPGRYALPKEVA